MINCTKYSHSSKQQETPQLIRKTSKAPPKKSNLQGFIEEIEKKKLSIPRKDHAIESSTKDKIDKNPNDPANWNSLQFNSISQKSYNDPINESNYSNIESNNLYVGNLNNNINEKSLCWLFSHYGPLCSFKKIQQDPKFYKTYAFVAFSDQHNALKALHKLNGYNFQGCELRIKWGKPQVPTIRYDSLESTYNCERSLLRLSSHACRKSELPFKSIEMHSKHSIGSVKPFVFDDLAAISDPEEFSDYIEDEPLSDTKNAHNSSDPTSSSSSSSLSNSYDNLSSQESNSSHSYPISRKNNISVRCAKVIVPQNRRKLQIINRTAQFVAHGGPVFEALLMNNERENLEFKFMIDFQSLEHLYYRWRLFSLLNGDSFQQWRTEPFYMYSLSPEKFNQNIIIIPPTSKTMVKNQNKSKTNDYDQNTDEDTKNIQNSGVQSSSKSKYQNDIQYTNDVRPNKALADFQIQDNDIILLSHSIRQKLIDILLKMSLKKKRIGQAMLWCIMNAESSYHILSIITRFIMDAVSNLRMKVGALYLIHDIIINCSVKMPNAFKYRKMSMLFLPIICSYFHGIISSVEDKNLSKIILNLIKKSLRHLQLENIYNIIFTESLVQILHGQRRFDLKPLNEIRDIDYLSLMNAFSCDKTSQSHEYQNDSHKNQENHLVSTAPDESNKPVLIANIYDNSDDSKSSASDDNNILIDGMPIDVSDVSSYPKASFTNLGFKECEWDDGHSKQESILNHFSGESDENSDIDGVPLDEKRENHNIESKFQRDASDAIKNKSFDQLNKNNKDSLESSKWNSLASPESNLISHNDDDSSDEDIDGIPI